jgi:hypothetical protein
MDIHAKVDEKWRVCIKVIAGNRHTYGLAVLASNLVKVCTLVYIVMNLRLP